MRRHPVRALLIAVLAVALAGCGTDDPDDGDVAAEGPGGVETDITIAVTTTVLGDVVGDLVGDLAEVVTIMPSGANPHDFQASARDAAVLAGADAVIVNGGGFEEGLASVVDGASSDGVPVLDALELLGGSGAHADDEAHDDDDEAHAHDDDAPPHDDDVHPHGDDAHFFTDPLAVAAVVDALAAELPGHVPAIDAAALRAQADDLVADLEALDAEIVETLSVVPTDRRVLVTDHDVLTSFASRYGFEIIATVIPTGSTSDGVSGGALDRLAELLRSSGVPAVFTEQTASAKLADTLAAEVGDVAVVSLYAESLGPKGSEADTYDAMMRLNAQRIADALGD